MPAQLDRSFLSLPLSRLADAALGRARELGAAHAAVRIDRVRAGRILLHDAALRSNSDTTMTGLGIRLVHGGAWGFAGTTELTAEAAAAAAERAAQFARSCAALNRDPVELAAEPVHHRATWVSDYRINPFDVPETDRAARLAEWSGRLLGAPEIVHVLAKLGCVQENKFYADLAGTVSAQQRVRVHPQLLAVGVDPRTGTTETLRTVGPPTARGLEYLSGSGWDWDGELAELPEQLAEKLRAPSVEPGDYDLVIDPSNLWLTIHESVGHATELDRALGYEAGYAGTSFATLDERGSLRYGSAPMNVTADRTAEHGLATVGFDDEGVAAQSWDLVTDGVLTGFQLDRHTARLSGAERSNGCAYAESALHPPIQRMPNVSLRPAPGGPGLAGLIGAVADGIYLAGSGSWSIDMERRNFQFTAQRCHRIRNGRLAGQLRDVAYQAGTTGFWRSLGALGGEHTYQMFGADLCGKGQPVQVAPVSHGSPAALFHRVRVRNATEEAGL
jgi:TldD protein